MPRDGSGRKKVKKDMKLCDSYRILAVVALEARQRGKDIPIQMTTMSSAVVLPVCT